MSTKSFSWLHIPGMLQWVENKKESNQGAINTGAFICWWGFYRLVISLWIHQLLPWGEASCCSAGLVSKLQTAREENEEETTKKWRMRKIRRVALGVSSLDSKLRLAPAITQTSALTRLRGGPRRAVYQVCSDRLTMSTVEVFHS